MGDTYEMFEEGNEGEVERFEVRDLRVKTRFAIDNVFWDEFVPVLGTTISMVYVALVRHANKEQKTWPSQERVARQVGVTREWVGRFLTILEYFNLIKGVRVGKMCTNRYYLIDEKHWRRDFDVMEAELADALRVHDAIRKAKKKGGKVMCPEVTSLMRPLRSRVVTQRAHGLVVGVTSNRKDNQERITKKDRANVVVKKKERTRIDPDLITKGEGSKSREYFDEKENAIVREYYD